MATFLVFIISLILIILLFVMKDWELSRGRKIFLERQFENFDAWIHKILLAVRFWWGQVNFKNTVLIFSAIVNFVKTLTIKLKRRFDHEQSHFFTKRDHDFSKNKGPVSFFLKDVSDYKKKLREERGEE